MVTNKLHRSILAKMAMLERETNACLQTVAWGDFNKNDSFKYTKLVIQIVKRDLNENEN